MNPFLQESEAIPCRRALSVRWRAGWLSAPKRDPPRHGKRAHQGSIVHCAGPVHWPPLLCSCSCCFVLLRFAGQVKRSRALRGRNPTRDSLADGAPMVHLLPAPVHPRGRGPAFLPHWTPEFMPLKIPGVWGQSPQGSVSALACRVSFARLFLLVLHRLPEAKAFAIHLEDAASMRQAIQ